MLANHRQKPQAMEIYIFSISQLIFSLATWDSTDPLNYFFQHYKSIMCLYLTDGYFYDTFRFIVLRKATIKIQESYRAWKSRIVFLRKRRAAIVIQVKNVTFSDAIQETVAFIE